jgi:hypothetical protein
MSMDTRSEAEQFASRFLAFGINEFYLGINEPLEARSFVATYRTQDDGIDFYRLVEVPYPIKSVVSADGSRGYVVMHPPKEVRTFLGGKE